MNNNKGYTLVETIVATALIGTIVGGAVTFLPPFFKSSRDADIVQKAAVVEQSLSVYFMQHKRYPDNIDELKTMELLTPSFNANGLTYTVPANKLTYRLERQLSTGTSKSPDSNY